MAIKITDDCINCGACEPECPNNAIYENGASWTINEGTSISVDFNLMSGETVDAFAEQPALSADYYFIVPEKCTECVGFHDEPQCASVCPVDCCLPDEKNNETEEQLIQKQKTLHN